MAELQPLRGPIAHGYSITRKPVGAGYNPLKDTTRTEVENDLSEDRFRENAPSGQKRPPIRSDYRPKNSTFGWLYSIYNYSWVIEIASLIVSYLAFAATITTLVIHQGKPLPQWPRIISVNSLIAIFTAIMRAALILPVAEGLGQIKWSWFRNTRTLVDLDRLDAATRGPWGSFLLLITYFKNYLALMGAIITVVSLAIDPFSQQVIEYNDCSQVIFGGRAFISSSSNYSLIGGPEAAARWKPDSEMISAIYTALIATPVDDSTGVQTTCDTGNCTFPTDGFATHMSLAMCGQCEDQTSQINKATDPPINLTTSGGSVLDVKYTLPVSYDPGGQNLNLSILGSSNSDRMGGPVWLVLAENYRTAETSWYTAQFSTIMWANCSCEAQSTFGIPPCHCTPFAATCSIYPCVKTYNANITNGLLNETEVPNEAVPRKPTDVSVSSFIVAVSETVRGGERHPCSNSSVYSPEFPVYGYSRGWYPEGCLWEISDPAHNSWRELLTKILLTGQVTTAQGERRPNKIIGDPWLQTVLHNGTANIDTLNAYVKGLAQSMTNTIRRTGDITPAMRVQGTATHRETCIHVRWAWLSLPATLLVMATGFLTAVIWRIGRGDADVWKSSPLALLFHGLDPQVRHRHGSLRDLQSMDEMARSVRVRLEMGDHGSHFSVK